MVKVSEIYRKYIKSGENDPSSKCLEECDNTTINGTESLVRITNGPVFSSIQEGLVIRNNILSRRPGLGPLM